MQNLQGVCKQELGVKEAFHNFPALIALSVRGAVERQASHGCLEVPCAGLGFRDARVKWKVQWNLGL